MKLILDFETFYSVPYSLTKMTTMEYVRDDLFKIHGVGIQLEDWSAPEYIYEEDVEETLLDIWESHETIELVCHNTRFDAYILARRFGLYADFYYDTMSMSAGLFPGQKSNLASLCERLWPSDPTMRKGEELKQTKGIEDLSPELSKTLGEYCIQDVRITREAFNLMIGEYPEQELRLIDLHIRMFVNPKFILDRGTVEEFLAEEQRTQTDLVAASGYTAKQLGSNPQFAEILESLDIPIPKKISPTTNKETFAFAKNDINFQELQTSNTQFKHIWDARLAVKSTINRTRAKRMLNAADPYTNELAVALKYYGAHTGRASGAEKLNFQNLRRGSILRRALHAPEDHSVVVVDSAQIEARVLAWVSNQLELLQLFADDIDVYCAFANHIYPDKTPVTKEQNPLERFVGKVAILGLGYGMGWRKFQKTLEAGALGADPLLITDSEAEKIVQTYRRANYMIQGYWGTASKMLFAMMQKDKPPIPWGPLMVTYQQIILPNGMALKYPGLRLVDGENGRELVYNLVLPSSATDEEMIESRSTVRTYGAKMVENIVQALARIIVMDQMLEINEKYPVALTVHDEVVSIVPDEIASDAFAFMLKTMKTPPNWAPNLPLDAEGGVDYCYSK